MICRLELTCNRGRQWRVRRKIISCVLWVESCGDSRSHSNLTIVSLQWKSRKMKQDLFPNDISTCRRTFKLQVTDHFVLRFFD